MPERVIEIEQPAVDVSSSSSAEWLSTARFAALLATLIFIAFPHVIIGSESFIFRDFGLFGYPVAHYHRECFWRGEIPLWNPYNNFGLPFLAQWNTMVLYPPSLIYLVLPLPWSLSIFTLLHLFFGGVGMYKLACRWTGVPIAAAVAGIAFAFNGFTLNCLMWPNHTASLAWAPWVILAVTRSWSEGGRQMLIAALFGALQMLSGTPEIILFTWLIIGALWLCNHAGTVRQAWRSALRFGLVILLVSGLSAAQLLPFLDLLPHTQRGATYEAGQWSFQTWGWANLLVPLFRNFPTDAGVYFQPNQILTSSYYPGLLAILLTLLAVCWVRDRRVWLLAALVVSSIILGMGDRAHVYTWLREAFPAVGVMRYTVKFVIILTAAWPLLAAFGLAALLNRNDCTGAQGKRLRLTVAIAGSLALTAAAIVAYARLFPAPQENWTMTFYNGTVRIALLAVTTAVLWAMHRMVDFKRQRFLQALLLSLFFADLFKHVPAQNPTAEPAVFDVKLSSLEQMNPRPRLGESRAIISLYGHKTFAHTARSNMTVGYLGLRAGLFANVNLLAGIPKTDGFYALYFAPERDIYLRLFSADDQPRPALARFVGISQVTSPTNVVAWSPLTNYMPLVTAGQIPEFQTRAATLVRMISSGFSPETTVFLPIAARNQITVTNAGGAHVVSSRITAHRIEAEVEAVTPSMVVLSQAYFHPWKAFVNGQPVKLWRANHAFQALQVQPGSHRVELIYSDNAFYLGVTISVIALGTLASAWLAIAKGRSSAAVNVRRINGSVMPAQVTSGTGP